MQRRTLLTLGIGTATVFVIAGGAALLMTRPGLAGGSLAEAGVEVFLGVARGVLDGCLPADPAAREAALAAHCGRLNGAIAALPRATQDELSQLLALLASAPGRVAFAGLGTAWPQASVDEIQQALQSMRSSSLALRMQAYHALRDLTNAAFFADARVWPLLGYPGPDAV